MKVPKWEDTDAIEETPTWEDTTAISAATLEAPKFEDTEPIDAEGQTERITEPKKPQDTGRGRLGEQPMYLQAKGLEFLPPSEKSKKIASYVIPARIDIPYPTGIKKEFPFIKGNALSIPTVVGSREPFTWAPEGHAPLSEQLWDYVTYLQESGIDLAAQGVKKVLGAELYKSINDNFAVKGLKEYFGTGLSVWRAIGGTMTELTEATLTPEGILMALGVESGLGKLGALAKSTKGRIYNPELIPKRFTRMNIVADKVTNGFIPTKKEMAGASAEAKQLKDMYDVVMEIPETKDIQLTKGQEGSIVKTVIRDIDETILKIPQEKLTEPQKPQPVFIEKPKPEEFLEGYLNTEGQYMKTGEGGHAEFVAGKEVQKMMAETGFIRTKRMGPEEFGIEIVGEPTPKQLATIYDNTRGGKLHVDISDNTGNLVKSVTLDEVKYDGLKNIFKTDAVDKIPVKEPEIPSTKLDVGERPELTDADMIPLNEKPYKSEKRNVKVALQASKLNYELKSAVVRKKLFKDENTKLPKFVGERIEKVIHNDFYDKNPGVRKIKDNTDLAPYIGELKSLVSSGANNIERGYSEFVKQLLIDPKKLKERAPMYYETFMNKLRQSPELEYVLAKYQRALTGHDNTSIYSLIGKKETGFMSTLSKHIEEFIDSPRIKLSDIADEIMYEVFNDAAHFNKMLMTLAPHDVKALSKNPAIINKIMMKGKGGRIRAVFNTGYFDTTFKKITEPFIDVIKDSVRGFRDVETGKKYPSLGKEGSFDEYMFVRNAIDQEKLNLSRGRAQKSAYGKSLKELETRLKELDSKTAREMFDRYVKWKRAIDYNVYVKEMQILTPEQYEQMLKEHPNYVPTERILDIISEGGKPRAGIYRFKGGRGKVQNPIDSVINQVSSQIAAADQAVVMRLTADIAEKSPGGNLILERVKDDVMPHSFEYKQIKSQIESELKAQGKPASGISPDEIITSWIKKNTKPDEVLVFRDGKPTKYRWKDRKIQELLVGSTPKESGFINKWFFKMPATVLRAGATVLNPDFMLRNFVRDTFSRVINTGGSGLGVFPDMLKAMLDMKKGSELWKLYQASGTPMSGFYGADLDSLKIAVRQVEDGYKYYFKHPFEAIKQFNSLIEDATRFAEWQGQYNRLSKYQELGKTQEKYRKFTEMPEAEKILKASYEGREVSLDFLKGGKWAREYNQMTAFFTAGIQGVYKAASMMKNHPMRTMVRGITTISLPTIALWLLNRNNPYYRNQDDYKRWFFFNVPINKNGNMALIPKPPVWATVFSNFLEEGLDWLDSESKRNVTAKDFLEKLTFEFANDVGFGVVPNGLQWFMAHTMNYDWFRGVAFQTEQDKKYSNHLQYGPNTSETAKKLAEVTKDLPKFVQINPKTFEGKIRTMAGGTGRFTLDIADIFGYLAKKAGVIKSGFEKTPNIKRWPVVRSFISEPQYVNRGMMEKFYDIKKHIDTKYNDTKLYEKRGQRDKQRNELRANMRVIKYRDLFSVASANTSELYKIYMKKMQDNNMDSDTKAKWLKKYGDKINSIMQRAVDKYYEEE